MYSNHVTSIFTRGATMSAQVAALASAPAQPLRLVDQLRALAMSQFGRSEPGERYADWARRFILFHGKRHPRELGMTEIGGFLEHLAPSEKDPLRSREQAREA